MEYLEIKVISNINIKLSLSKHGLQFLFISADENRAYSKLRKTSVSKNRDKDIGEKIFLRYFRILSLRTICVRVKYVTWILWRIQKMEAIF